tara:strand:- start:20524 stop:21009 length:486 start_codon:yes stop_codon:yes gene_type:complete
LDVSTLIILDITGGIKRDRILAEKVIKFCIKKLLPRHRNLDITCTLSDTLKDGLYGWCIDSYEKKTYEIGIDKRLSRDGIIENVDDGIDAFITTICHEMIHVMQYATKKYVQPSASYQMWKCKDSKYRNYARTDYNKQPWETQAYAMEDALAEEFIETYNE